MPARPLKKIAALISTDPATTAASYQTREWRSPRTQKYSAPAYAHASVSTSMGSSAFRVCGRASQTSARVAPAAYRPAAARAIRAMSAVPGARDSAPSCPKRPAIHLSIRL